MKPVDPARRWRNAALVRERDVGRTRWLCLLLVSTLAALAPLTVYLMQQMEYVRVRYKIEELRSQHERLVEMEQRLRVERASLITPARVERSAEDLGLAHPSPTQVVVVRRAEPGPGGLLAHASERR